MPREEWCPRCSQLSLNFDGELHFSSVKCARAAIKSDDDSRPSFTADSYLRFAVFLRNRTREEEQGTGGGRVARS